MLNLNQKSVSVRISHTFTRSGCLVIVRSDRILQVIHCFLDQFSVYMFAVVLSKFPGCFESIHNLIFPCYDIAPPQSYGCVDSTFICTCVCYTPCVVMQLLKSRTQTRKAGQHSQWLIPVQHQRASSERDRTEMFVTGNMSCPQAWNCALHTQLQEAPMSLILSLKWNWLKFYSEA